jgi:membrane-bound serine protease (ClpP class)
MKSLPCQLMAIAFCTLLGLPGHAKAATWMVVDVGIIGAASDLILESAMAEVKEKQMSGLIIRLDTPGGSLESTRTMVKNMLSSSYPVIVWVGPSGSRAASAGAFITLAAHRSYMAEGTNIGAAHPIQAGGQDIPGDARKKVEEDTMAFIESIAEQRGRDVEVARSFVKSSVSMSSQEALQFKMIDGIAESLDAVFKSLHEQTVILGDKSEVTLDTQAIQIVEYNKSLQESFLEILSNPNLFYLLFLAGLIGIGFELTHPGSLIPGTLGAISMVLALMATSVLPVNFGAMILIILGICFLVAEMFLPSFGILGIGGIISFLFGSFLIVDNSTGLGVSLWTILPSAFFIAGISLFIGYLLVNATKNKVLASTTLEGKTGIAMKDFSSGKGRIKIEGEIWQASSEDETLLQGERVEVMSQTGLELHVRKSKEVL